MSKTWPLSLWQDFAMGLPAASTGDWFTMSAVLRVEGEFDPGLLTEAATRLVARHELLRSRLDLGGAEPVQVVEDVVRPDVEVLGEDALTPQEWLHCPVSSTGHTPLKLRVGRRSAREHVLSVHLHHLLADPETLWRVVADLAALYSARCGGPEPEPPTAQFGEFTAFEADLVRSGHAEAEAWWRGTLAGAPFASPPRTAVGEPFALRRPVLSAEEAAELESGSRALRGTPFTTLLTALTQAMGPHTSGGDHLLFSTLFRRRDHPRWRTMMGPCIVPTYLVVPLDTGPDGRAVREHLIAAHRFSRFRSRELERMSPALADPDAFLPFVELIPQLRPVAVAFGPARAVVDDAAGPRDTGSARDLGLRFRKALDGSVAVHMSGNGRGWTGKTVHGVLDDLPNRIHTIGRGPVPVG